MHQQFLASDLADSLDRGSLGDGSGRVQNALVQVVRVTGRLTAKTPLTPDVGTAAHAQLEALYARQAQRREGKRVEAPPRGMLRLEMSDGYVETPVTAYEYRTIPELSVDMRLGAKLLLTDILYERDASLLLTPQNTVVKGGFVPEMAADAAGADARLEDALCRRLGKRRAGGQAVPEAACVAAGAAMRDDTPTVDQAAPDAAHGAAAAAAATRDYAPTSGRASRTATSADVPDDVWDLDAEAAMLEAEQALHVHSGGAAPHAHGARTAALATPNGDATDAQHHAHAPRAASPGGDPSSSASNTSWLLQQLHETPRRSPVRAPQSQTPTPSQKRAGAEHQQALKIPRKDASVRRAGSSPPATGSAPEKKRAPPPEYIEISSDSD